mgnify:CR=1 FL=1
MAENTANDRSQAAGLRLLQQWREDRIVTKDASLDMIIDDIETNGGAHEPMTAEEIDALCELINTIDGIALENGK